MALPQSKGLFKPPPPSQSSVDSQPSQSSTLPSQLSQLSQLSQPESQVLLTQATSSYLSPAGPGIPAPPPSEPRFRYALHAVSQTGPAMYIRRAAVAASFPLRGIWYFSRRPGFWPLFVGRLAPLSVISFLVYFILFAVVFVPQWAFLAIFHGWGAWINAVVLVLGEGLVIIQALFEGFFVDECRVDVFDATLLDCQLGSLIAPHRILYPDAPNPVRCLGKPTSAAVFQPWSMIQIFELVVFLPLNMIPIVGTPAFLLITGSRLGRLCHHRWFTLRGLSKVQQREEINRREWDYLWFGAVAMILELVPVLSFLFLLTTAAGAGLWTAALEKEEKERTQGIQGGAEVAYPRVAGTSFGSAGAVPTDPPPAYEDSVV